MTEPVKWEDDGERFPAVKAMIGDLQYTVFGQSPKGVRWWWCVEIGSDDAGQEDLPTAGEAMKAAEEFAPKLQAFLDSLKGTASWSWVITEWDYITGSHLKGVATDEENAKCMMQEFSPHPPQKSEFGKGWYAPTADEVADNWRYRGPYVSAYPVEPNVLIGAKDEEDDDA